MHNLLKKLVIGTPLEMPLRAIFQKPNITFTNSEEYWESRYLRKGNSGAGSYGRLAKFKAEVINKFVHEENIQTVIEFGCGDGNQLTLAEYPSYIGFDVSQKTIESCRKLFIKDKSKSFYLVSEFDSQSAELVLSLDVIYHLVEDDVYEGYMNDLFSAASKFVIIYSSNYDEDSALISSHVRHRCFTNWVDENAKEFEFVAEIPNKYPFDASNPNDTSLADFYIFKK